MSCIVITKRLNSLAAARLACASGESSLNFANLAAIFKFPDPSPRLPTLATLANRPLP